MCGISSLQDSLNDINGSFLMLIVTQPKAQTADMSYNGPHGEISLCLDVRRRIEDLTEVTPAEY